jgi:hypothetical protein
VQSAFAALHQVGGQGWGVSSAFKDGDRMSGILKRRRTGVAWTMGVLLLVVFIAVVAHHADWRRFAELLRSAQPAWLGAHDVRIEAALAAKLPAP